MFSRIILFGAKLFALNVARHQTEIYFAQDMFRPENIENTFFNQLDFRFLPDALKTGVVLASEPFLEDPNFHRTVILLTEYSTTAGAVGLVINKPTEIFMADIMEGFPTDIFQLHYGGPVNPENLFFIHTLGTAVQDAVPVLDGLFCNGNFQQLSSLAQSNAITQQQVKFIGGYSGWSPGQLEEELTNRSWIISELSASDIMEMPADDIWKMSLKSLGKKFSIMADFPEDPGLN